MRVIVQHPETVGSGPQLFQTFSVHRSPVTKIMLSEKHLISGRPRPPHPQPRPPLTLTPPPPVCADNNHVRTWTVTRFRGMISTQPGSTPLSSFKILSLDDFDGRGGCGAGTEIGACRRRPPPLPPTSGSRDVVLQVRTARGTTSRCSSRGWSQTPTASTSGCRPTGRGEGGRRLGAPWGFSLCVCVCQGV